MYDQMSLLDIPSVTFSPESVSGHSPCARPESPTITPSGLCPALASLSARQAKEKGLLTSGTFGQPRTTSSASADLSALLVSRLTQRLNLAGGI